MSRIAILGAGAWGTALAISLARRGGHQIVLWSHSPLLAEQLTDVGENLPYLPGFTLPADIFITSDLPAAIFEADLLVAVTPSQYLRETIAHIAPLLTRDQIILSASKGIEEGSFLRMTQVIASITDNPSGVVSGPSFAQEVAAGLPTAIVVAAIAAILGHCFPVWLRFRGGKGVASALGVFLALTWPSALSILAVFAVIFLLSRYVSLASIIAAATLPLFALYFVPQRSPIVLTGFLLIPLLIIVKHHANIRRLLAGTENRFGSKKVAA